MKGFRFTLAHATMQHRGLVLLLMLAITAFFAVGLSKVELKTIFSDLFPKNHPFVETYQAHPNFGNPLTVTVMVTVILPKIFTVILTVILTVFFTIILTKIFTKFFLP